MRGCDKVGCEMSVDRGTKTFPDDGGIMLGEASSAIGVDGTEKAIYSS